jgi:hypothetical protein
MVYIVAMIASLEATFYLFVVAHMWNMVAYNSD